MRILTIIILLAVTLGQFLTTIHVAPQALKYLPEVLSALVLVAVVMAGPRQRFRLIAPRYWVIFAAAAIELLCSVLVNHMAPGPLIQGLRFYIRAIPMFFLPAVFEVSEAEIRTQLRWLLGIALLQLPLSLYQRYLVYSHGRNSGDEVVGTLVISSIESIFLIASTCIAAAMMLRGRMSRLTFFGLFALFLVPTTINETKGSIFLLPIGLLTTLIAGSPPGRRLRIGVSAAALVGVFIVAFLPIYDFFAAANNPYPYTLESFFTHPENMQRYLDKDADLGSRGEVGRVDAVVEPLRAFSTDPIKLMFGVGVGNASLSSLGNDYTGEYYSLLGRYTGASSGAAFLIEIGLLGLFLALLLDWLILRDSLVVLRQDNSIFGTLALGWLGITVVMLVATFYKNMLSFESLSYLFWYYSGVIAAQRMKLELGLQPLSVPAVAVARPRAAMPRPRLLR